MINHTVIAESMQRALVLALRSPAVTTSNPNPPVGCVLVDRNGRIVAEGWHLGVGTAHAEVDALNALPVEWRDRAGELTAVVTLEPCNHQGRTGPCTQALIDAGIGAVAFGQSDIGEQSAGGAETLRRAGVAVQSGVLDEQTTALLADWHGAEEKRPGVVVKYAQSLDGRGAAVDGSSQWITSAQSRADVHRRRAEADLIVVGTGTLYTDDPSLTARDESGALLVPADQQPVPVVIGRREIPAAARLRAHPAVSAHGLPAPPQFTGEDLFADLGALRQQFGQQAQIFVEGGPTLSSSLVRAGLVTEFLIYIAPTLLGGHRMGLADLGIETLAERIDLDILAEVPLGPDRLLRAVPLKPSD